jgi:steroid delta-isomerase-like uncharacterized protein
MTAEETVTAYWRAWTEHNRDLLLRLLAPDFVSRSSLSNGRPAGKDLIAKGFHMFDRALPNLREEVVSMVSEGDRVACEVVETATFTGPMELSTGAIAPTNRSYTLPIASFFRINADGLIAEQRTYWDTARWAEQVGIDPALFAPHDL